MMSEGNFLKRLPDVVLEKTIGFSKENKVENVQSSFLKARLPESDKSEVDTKLRQRFHLNSVKANFIKRSRRKGCPRNPGLSNTKKRALGLYSIERKGLKFEELLPLHRCWVEYMENMLNLKHHVETGWVPNMKTSAYEDFTQLLWKADYHGAFIKVIRSTCPSLVGIEGILVFESRNTIRLLGQDDTTRCIPKISCEFALKIGKLQVKFLGKFFMVKPTERSVKKIKGGKYFDL